MSDLNNLVWEHKYRPKVIEDTILPEVTKKMLRDIISSGNIPNFLFHGTAGTGKTTVARALANELGADFLFINASMDGNIDTLRTTITQFVSTVSFTDSKKFVLLDECLSEHEFVRVGTIDDWAPVQLNSLEFDKKYPVVSFNTSTGEFENDVGYIISDKHDELYEVTLSSGKTIVANSKHPFMCVDSNGNIIERTIEDGLENYSVIVAK